MAGWDGVGAHWPCGGLLKPDPSLLPLLRNVHMGFLEASPAEQAGTRPQLPSAAGGTRDLTLLFTAVEGFARRSYGLNVARLAKLPAAVLATASAKAALMDARGSGAPVSL